MIYTVAMNNLKNNKDWWCDFFLKNTVMLSNQAAIMHRISRLHYNSHLPSKLQGNWVSLNYAR